jgi:hypothetical protein
MKISSRRFLYLGAGVAALQAARLPKEDGNATAAEALPASLSGTGKRPHLMLCLIAVMCVSCVLGAI